MLQLWAQTAGGRSRQSARCCATLGTSSVGAAVHETHTAIHTDILTSHYICCRSSRGECAFNNLSVLFNSSTQQQEERTLERQGFIAYYIHHIFISYLFSFDGLEDENQIEVDFLKFCRSCHWTGWNNSVQLLKKHCNGVNDEQSKHQSALDCFWNQRIILLKHFFVFANSGLLRIHHFSCSWYIQDNIEISFVWN